MPAEIQIHPIVDGSLENPYMKEDKAIPYITDPRQSNSSPAESAHSVFIFLFIRISDTIPKGTRNANMLLHPKYWVSNPPITGPVESPRYTAVIFIPIAFPLPRAEKQRLLLQDLFQISLHWIIPEISLKLSDV